MMVQQFLLMIHMAVCFALIGLVLIQHGKGADVGAAFGSGASGTVFGSRGSGSFLFKLTGLLALTFFITSLYLGHLAAVSQHAGQHSLLDGIVPVTEQQETPNP